MSGVAWPDVRDRLVAAAPTVVGAGVSVYDGPIVSNDSPAAYLVIGHTPSTGDDSAGRFDQSVGPDGFSALETGTVVGELGAVTGDSTVPTVWATFTALAAWIQADQTLGGTLTPGSTVTVSADVVEAQTTTGAVQRLLLTFAYTTRLP